MNIGDGIQETTAGTSTSVIVVSGATANNRSFSAAVAAGEFAVGAVNIPLRVEDDAGSWLTGAFTLTAPAGVYTLTQTAFGASSTGSTGVVLAGTVRKVTCTLTSLLARTFLSNADGLAIGGLPLAGALSGTDIVLVTQAGIDAQTTLAALKTYFGATVAEVITVATPTAKVTGTAFTLSGTYANGTPAALDYSLDGGNTWQAALTPTITGGNYSFSLSLASANAAQTINVRDHGSIGIIGATNAFAVTGAAVQALTVSTPAAQAPNVAFTVAGTYVNGTPAALDYSLDGGATWVAALTPTIGSGNYSFNLTITSANAAQTLKVRDHTTLVAGTSGSFAVAAPVQSVTVATPTAQVIGVPFNVTGTYANGTPTALDYRLSDDAAGVWTAVTGATIGSGAFSFSITPASANAARTVSVRDRTTLVAGTSGAYAVTAAPVQTIAVNTPAAQTVGVAYNVTGTYANGTPAALDYSTDGGATWTAAATPTIGSGTYSFSHTSTTASPTKVMKVRDHTNTTIIGTSAAYVVNAAPAPTYILTGPPAAGAVFSTANAQQSPGVYATQNMVISVKDAGGVAAPIANIKMGWSKSATVQPFVFTDATFGGNNNSIKGMAKVGAWVNPGDQYYGLYTPASSLYAWGTAGTYYLWVVTSDGFAKVYDNGTGTPVGWVLT